MKKSKGMQLGALLAAMLLLGVAFVAAVGAQGVNEERKVMSPNGRYIYNESDFEKAVISSGTIAVPYTDDINERHNISRNAMIGLYKRFNVPGNEIVSLECDFKNGNCTYEISNKVQGTPITSGRTPLSPSASTVWAEDAKYNNPANTTSFNGHWKVPKGPSNQTGPVLFYFIALDRSFPNYNEILQPVLEWNNSGSAKWDIVSWYCVNNQSCQRDKNYKFVSVNDSVAGYLEYQGNPLQWWIYTDDITTGTESVLNVSSSGAWHTNYVTLETYGVNSCSNLPGGADFTGLSIMGATPSWSPEYNATAKSLCQSLNVNVVSSHEVQLNTGN